MITVKCVMTLYKAVSVHQSVDPSVHEHEYKCGKWAFLEFFICIYVSVLCIQLPLPTRPQQYFHLTLFVPAYYSVNVIARSLRTTTPLRESTKKSTSPKFGKAKRRRRTSPWRHHLTNLSGNTLHTFHCQSHLHIAVSSLSTFL